MTQRELQESMAAAVAHHQAGRLADAEPIYRRILAEHPNQPDALHLLGALAGQSGRLDEAIDHISRAIASHPRQAVYSCNLSEMYRRAGRYPEALAAAQNAT